MGRLEELRINAYLSEVARGYSNNAFVAQHLFPEITSEKEKIDIFEFNKFHKSAFPKFLGLKKYILPNFLNLTPIIFFKLFPPTY